MFAPAIRSVMVFAFFLAMLTRRSSSIQGGARGWLARGFAISGLNPKAILLFVVLLPQFTRRDAAWSVAAQIVALGLLHLINCAAVYSVVGLGSQAVMSTRPKAARRVRQLFGGAMVVVAVILFGEQVVAFAR